MYLFCTQEVVVFFLPVFSCLFLVFCAPLMFNLGVCYFNIFLLLCHTVVMVEVHQMMYEAGEERGDVEVCVVLDTPIATPLTVQLQLLETTPTSATGNEILTKN